METNMSTTHEGIYNLVAMLKATGKKYDIDKLHHIERKNIPLGEGTDYHSDYIQYLDSEWLHIINGSNWKGCDPNSLSRKENFINDLLKD